MARKRWVFPKETQRCIVQQLAHEYKVKLIYSEEWKASGVFLLPNTICIHPKTKDIIETFFHELGHVHCYRNKIFPAYHKYKNKKYTRQAILSTAFRAENYVDRWAEAECKTWFPEYEWHGSYRTEASRKWLMDYYKGATFEAWYA
jgi:hypothetical protein